MSDFLLNEVDVMHLRDAHRAWILTQENINTMSTEKAFIHGANYVIGDSISSQKWSEAYHDEAIDHAATAVNMQKIIKELQAEVCKLVDCAAKDNERTLELEKELQKRAKQIGIACLEHDLTHSLESGRCYTEMKEKLEVAVEAINYALEWSGDAQAWNRLNSVLEKINGEER